MISIKNSSFWLTKALIIIVFTINGNYSSAQNCEAQALLDSAANYLVSDLEKAEDFLNSVENSECLKSNSLGVYYMLRGDVSVAAGELGKAVELFEMAANIFDNVSDIERLVETKYKIGRVFISTSQFDKAILMFKENLSILSKEDFNESWVSSYSLRSSGNLGVIYSDLGDYNKALNHFLEVREICEKTGNERALSFTLNNIGSAYVRMGEPENALEYLTKSLQMKKELNLSSAIAASYLNIGSVYYEMNVFDKALQYFDSVLYENPDSYGLVDVYSNIASVFDAKMEYGSSESYYKRSLQIADSIGYIQGVAYAYGNLAELHAKQGKNYKALEEVEKSIELFSANNSLHNVSVHLNIKAAILEKLGRFRESVSTLRRYQVLNDSILSAQKLKEFNELNIVYETELREQEIQNLSSQNLIKDLELTKNRNRYLFIIGAVLIVLLVLIVFILNVNRKRLKTENQVVVTQQKLLRTQMNPHFIFNSLNSIQSFVLANNPNKAASYLAKFSKLTRSILENAAEESITLEREIELITNYLTLQHARQEDVFDWNIKVDEQIALSDINVPPMMAQPFIENCIEHAFQDLSRKGKIDIHYKLEDNNLLLIIEDDGVGIGSAHIKENHQSKALQITRERIHRSFKKIRLDIKNGAEGIGTMVRLQFEL